ncbi:hypothetical protein QYF36_003734 [Acer negundo]|nr:hypothetical protein QYF36_003734 [Acer negundo]
MRTISPPKKFYGSVLRNQENWRTDKKMTEPDDDRKGKLRVVGEKVNLEPLISKVACGGRNISINDLVKAYVLMESHFDGCKLSSPKVNGVTKILVIKRIQVNKAV